MQNRLKPHSDISTITIDTFLSLTKRKIKVSFMLKGMLNQYIFPNVKKLERADELWKATCFEVLLASDDEVYYELNFSPSLGWNFYVLDTYRAIPKAFDLVEEPSIIIEQKNDKFYIVFELEFKGVNIKKLKYYNVASIVLNQKNERTFWAIKHLNIQPDFHNKKSFLKIT